MKVTETSLAGVLIIEPSVYGDERGFFVETYQAERYREVLGESCEFVQDNHSRSRRGVLRGLHCQREYPQGKLVRVARGTVFDVAADINPSSETFGEWVGVELSDANGHQLWIPPGYVHGFVVLSEIADFEYKCTEYYHPDDELGIRWDDPTLGIKWPVDAPELSNKDQNNMMLSEYVEWLAES